MDLLLAQPLDILYTTTYISTHPDKQAQVSEGRSTEPHTHTHTHTQSRTHTHSHTHTHTQSRMRVRTLHVLSCLFSATHPQAAVELRADLLLAHQAVVVLGQPPQGPPLQPASNPAGLKFKILGQPPQVLNHSRRPAMRFRTRALLNPF